MEYKEIPWPYSNLVKFSRFGTTIAMYFNMNICYCSSLAEDNMITYFIRRSYVTSDVGGLVGAPALKRAPEFNQGLEFSLLQ